LAHQQARVWAVMAQLATRSASPLLDPGERLEAAAEEIRAELRLTRRAAAAELDRALCVAAVGRVAAAVRDGVLDRRRAVVLAEACADLPVEHAEALLDHVLPEAASVTATQLGQAVRRVAVALDPGWAERRYRAAVRQRRLVGYLHPDGTAAVAGEGLPADQAATACARVTLLAERAKRAGAASSLDQLRADLFLGLLDGRFADLTEDQIVAALVAEQPPVPAGVGVQVRVGLATLLGDDEQPGEIAGWGVITAATARDLAGRQLGGEWRFAIHDDEGRLLFAGRTRHRPTRTTSRGADRQLPGGIVELLVPEVLLQQPAPESWTGLLGDLAAQYAEHRAIEQNPAARFPGRPLRRLVQTRYQRCVFPGCRRPATTSDLDHRDDWATGGLTTEANLGPLCRHDHTNKTSRGWTLTRTSSNHFRWTSPLGRTHDVRIPPVAPPLPKPIQRPPPHEPPV
jgi:hypothetical protein